MPSTSRVNTQQVGRSGELLVQYKLLRFGIDSAPMTTDRGVDLVAINPVTLKTVSIQVKTASHRYAGNWLGWAMPKECIADYVAAVDLERDKCWLFTKEEFYRYAVGKVAVSGKWLWWYVPGYRPKRARSHPEEDFAAYEIEAVIPKLFVPY